MEIEVVDDEDDEYSEINDDDYQPTEKWFDELISHFLLNKKNVCVR